MRVSSNQIYDAGTLGIQRNQSSLFKLQNQLSTGRRVLAPEDDPIAAAQALVVSQSKAINEQHVVNQSNATSQLASLEGQLDSVTQVLQNVRERVVQAGNTMLTSADRQAIASEVEARLQELVGIANSQDGVGQYLFSGFRGATLPFAAAASGQIQYSGDDGERLLQVSDSRQIATSLSGNDVFMDIKSGNGTFVTSTGGNSISGGINQGTATIDAGSVLDPGQWSQAVNAYPSPPPPATPPFSTSAFRIAFSVVGSTTTYTLYDANEQPAPATPLSSGTYTPGQAIMLQDGSNQFGAQVVIQGQPADGDSFTVAPSTSQDMFLTLQNVVGLLRQPVGSSSMTATEYTNQLGAELTNIDRALDNVGRAMAAVGTRMKEVDSLNSTAEDVALQHDETLSNLQDLDYAKTISDFMRQQVNLEAAQKSFAQISQLSLFDIL